MFNCRSQRRNYLVLFALMLLLPVVSAFAFNNTFNLSVADDLAVPVPNAQVYVWDKYNPNTNANGVTDAQGQVQLVLPGLTPTATNLSNPSPNVGFLVLPDNAGNNTRLAFTVSETLFYNLFNADAIAPAEVLTVSEGCLVHIKPQINDGTAVVPGLVSGMNVFLPGVPYQVKQIYVNPTQINTTTPSYDLVFPYESHANVEVFGNGKWADHTERYFYTWTNNGTPIGMEVEKDLPIIHDRQEKGIFRVNLTEPNPTAPVVRLLHFGNNTIPYQGNVDLYLPKGMYSFNFALINDVTNFPGSYDFGEFGPPPAIWNNVDLTGSTQVVRDYTVDGGIGLTVDLQLGANPGDGDESALGASRVEILKKVNTNGFDQWMPFESTPGDLSIVGTVNSTTASVKLFHRLNDGVYKIRVYDMNNLWPGVIDYVSSPTKCFTYITGPEFTISNSSTLGTLTQNVILPQAAAVAVNIAVQNPTGLGAPMAPVLAYLNEYTLYSTAYTWDMTMGNLFVPFARVDKPIVVRMDYDEDTTVNTNPADIKVWAPIQAVAGQTISQALTVDIANFVNVTANVMVDQNGMPMPFTGTARVWFSPILPGTTDVPAYRAMGKGDYEPGLDNNMQTSGGMIPTFRAENGSSYNIAVVEDGYPLKLEGFVRHEEIFAVGGTGDVSVSEDRSFSGVIQVNGTPITSTQMVGVQLNTLLEKDFNDYGYYNVSRQAIVTGSGFRVAGIKAGRYEVILNLDNVDPYGGVYNVQTNPFIRREIVVSETSSTYPTPGVPPAPPTPAAPPVIFNLNTNAIGYVQGQMVDDLGNGIPGLHVAICRKGQQMADGYMNFYHRGQTVFLCTTDAQGNLITANPTNPTLVPLEAGDYDLFIEGIETNPVGFTYALSENMHESPPKASFKIFPSNQVTPIRGTIKRKFPLKGKITEGTNPLAYINFQILGENGESIGWGYTNEAGDYDIQDGVMPGLVQIGLIVEDGPNRRFYLKRYQMVPDQENIFNINLDPTTLVPIKMVTKDSGGAVLPEGPGSLFLFSNPELNFRAPHWYLTWIQSDDLGRMNMFVPNFTSEQAGFAYGFQGQEKWQEVSETDTTGTVQTFYRTYSAPELQILPVNQAEPVVLTWLKPATVTINATNIPAGRENKYIGVLMPAKMFAAGPQLNQQPTMPTTTPGMEGQSDRMLFSAFVNGGFHFANVKPGRDYVFVSYESLEPVFPESVEWAMEFMWKAVFRHASAPFMVNGNLVRAEAMRNLGALTLTSTQDPTLVMGPSDVKILFTADPVNTTGKVGWPVIFNLDDSVGFPIEVPADYALRVAYVAQKDSKYLSRVFDNIIVPVTGKTFDVVLKELKSLHGTFQVNGMPAFGQILLIPEGANTSDQSFQPIRINAAMGVYNGYLAPGHYIGYAMPQMGAPTSIDVVMPPAADLELNIAVTPGIMVSGSVTGPNALPIFDASVVVLRKPTKRSELLDGQDFLPYPAMMGSNEVRCGPAGQFFFPVEDGVDYYLQAIVPAGFSPGAPLKISANGTALSSVALTVGEGGRIIGSLNVPAFVEAKQSGQNALMDQFGTTGLIQADATIPDQNNRFGFTLNGLDKNIPYDITIWPAEPGKAVKRLTNVMVPADPTAAPLNIDLGDGYRIVGQLVDNNGLPISVKDVPVNLAMTLPMDILPVAANSKFPIKQNTEVPDPANFSLQDSILQGQYVNTNEFGQFEFHNVPQFLVAFIQTESGFNNEGIDYGRARTDNFPASFTTSNIMEVNVTVPVAGKIVGRLIDENGQPVNVGSVQAGFGESWAYSMVQPDGSFSLDGLAPGAKYMVEVDMVPGRVGVFRMGILVEPAKTTDLGSILVAKAVPVTGELANVGPVIQSAFQYGVPEGMGLSVVAIDGNHLITEDELLKGSFMQFVVGENELFFDPFMPPTTNMPFELFARTGKAHVGMVLHREDKSGVRSYVSWGWQPGLAIPSQEQLGTDRYPLGTAIDCPAEFGTIEGTLKHAVDTAARFNPEDAIIALYPVVASGAEFVVQNVPFPAAFTNPIDGRWFIRNVPAGTYRIKVVTRKYGTQFFGKIITIGSTLVKEDLALGTSVKRVFGKVVLKGATTTPVVSAKVNMFLRQLATTTDDKGEFSFFMPVGEFVIPQIEILKPGFEAKRILEFTGIATSGVRLESDLDLGTIELSDAVGKFEAYVKSADGNTPLVGAEVALVYKETTTSNIFTIGEILFTDESGRVQFTTVPTGRDVTFRARAFYHKPQIYTLASANNTGNYSDTITLAKANPKVFYTGIVTPNTTDSTKLNLKALFDFNQPVYQNRLGLTIADVDRFADATPVDLLGGRLTSMTFNNTIPNATEVIATVSYDVANDSNKVGIGRFSLVGGALFSKEFEVNPLDANGFTGRQTDDSGNPLPTGLTCPQGYLDPSIDSFSIVVASATAGDSVLDGTTTAPQFAGPTFEFTFGGDNFAGGTQHEGLFEITIKYEEGTALEPRWYDETNKRWSKVGIIDGSVQYDTPTPGYVTFKVSHLTKFAILKNVAGAASGLRCDFTGDSAINDNDLAAIIARNQLANAGVPADQLTAANINTVAGNILKGVTFTVSVVPNASIDDLNGDGNLDDNDLAFLIGWIQLKNAGLTSAQITETAVKTVSTGLLGSLSGTLSKFPGETVSR